MHHFQEIDINKVRVPAGRRPPTNMNALVASIHEIGLLHPITVMPVHDDAQSCIYQLVAGQNRLAAYRFMGRETIPANVLPLDPLEAEIAEIDENLLRQNMDVLERADCLWRRKKAHEGLYPETKHGGRPGKLGGGKLAKDPQPGSFVLSFLDDTVRKTGRGRTGVADEVQIASKLATEVKTAIRETPVANRKSDLLRLARLTSDIQQDVADKIVREEARTVSKALELLEQEKAQFSSDTPPYPPVSQQVFDLIYVALPWENPALSIADGCPSHTDKFRIT